MNERPFVRVRGGLELRLSPQETDLLRPLFGQMMELLDANGGDVPEDMRRLFPPAYADDVDAQAEFAHLTQDDLRESKVRALRLTDATFDNARLKRGMLAIRMNGEEQQAWLSSLNDLRLFLGTRLGVTEAVYDEPPDDPAFQVYLYLGWLEENLLETLM